MYTFQLVIQIAIGQMLFLWGFFQLSLIRKYHNFSGEYSGITNFVKIYTETYLLAKNIHRYIIFHFSKSKLGLYFKQNFKWKFRDCNFVKKGLKWTALQWEPPSSWMSIGNSVSCKGPELLTRKVYIYFTHNIEMFQIST